MDKLIELCQYECGDPRSPIDALVAIVMLKPVLSTFFYCCIMAYAHLCEYLCKETICGLQLATCHLPI